MHNRIWLPHKLTVNIISSIAIIGLMKYNALSSFGALVLIVIPSSISDLDLVILYHAPHVIAMSLLI